MSVAKQCEGQNGQCVLKEEKEKRWKRENVPAGGSAVACAFIAASDAGALEASLMILLVMEATKRASTQKR